MGHACNPLQFPSALCSCNSVWCEVPKPNKTTKHNLSTQEDPAGSEQVQDLNTIFVLLFWAKTGSRLEQAYLFFCYSVFSPFQFLSKYSSIIDSGGLYVVSGVSIVAVPVHSLPLVHRTGKLSKNVNNLYLCLSCPRQ